MPHIPKNEYEPVRNGGMSPTPGRLNWLVTDVIINYVNKKGLCYNTIHNVRAALESLKDGSRGDGLLAQQITNTVERTYPQVALFRYQLHALIGNVWDEFYRLVAAPYEEEVMRRNGNAYARLWDVEYQKREAEKQARAVFPTVGVIND